MTTREMLTLAARAMGRCAHTETRLERWEDGNDAGTDHICVACGADVSGHRWKPDADSGQCADMCAALLIGTMWWNHKVECWCVDELKDINIDSTPEQFADHNNDKSAAWRLAALRVTAEIGKGMRG